MNRLRRPGTQAAVVAVLGGVAVFVIAHVVFPYHTTNHDEAVYLQQAAMLLEGQLFLTPPVDGPFRPWFFVESEQGLYAKYTPVTAAMFAVGRLLGGFRVALGLIATGTLLALYHTVREAFDARTGVVATTLLLASPLFLVEASVFLSYVPTTFWNLVFAASYLHADRTGSRRTAALAGAAIGVAFFSRPYTAVLFAAPFIAHALWSLREFDRPVLERTGLTALFGLLGVAVTLAYNGVVTGDPLVFPYQAFAPQDGLGFGERRILGYSRDFTPLLSLRASAEILWVYATEWVVAGPLGTLAGVWAARKRGLDARKLTVLGVGLTVPLGNLYFWGNLNILGDLAAPNDGLIHFLGPYYHMDLLVPTVTFAVVGLLAGASWVRDAVPERVSAERVRPAFAALVLLCATVGGGATLATAAAPVADSYEVTQQYERAYEPFEGGAPENSLVFLPRTYGDWLNHPFQPLRNDPGFDGDTVYAMQRQQFAVVGAYPDRQHYRYAFRGEWAPFLGRSVDARLQPVERAAGETVTTNVSATFPERAEAVTLRLTNGSENASGNDYATVPANEPLSVSLRTDTNQTVLAGSNVDDTVSVPTPERGTVTLVAFVDFGADQAFKYRVELPVNATADGVEVVTPRLEVCRDERLCGGNAAYVPGAHEPGIELNATVEPDQ